MKLLLTIDDIAKYRPASEGIPVERINPYIQEAQEIDLCTVIGQVLYADFLAKFDQTGDHLNVSVVGSNLDCSLQKKDRDPY